jgi:perosamine synthetase
VAKALSKGAAAFPPGSIGWFLPEVGAAEKQAVLQVIDSNYLNDGAVARDFEKRIAALVGVRHCVAVTSGTAAISLALLAAGIGPGDEVIVPDLTFVATANAVRMIGADVKLVDVEPKRFTIDPERVAAAIGPRTRAIVPVDVNGRGADYDALAALCRRHGLRMICDAAEALGSRYHGRPLGSFGDAGCFSFSAAKTVTTGQGGMIATDDTELYHRLLELKDQGRRAQGTGGDDLHPVMGYNFKFTNLQAAIGIAQLELLETRLEQARRRDAWFHAALADCPGVDVSGLVDNEGEARQWADALIDDRDAVRRAFDSAGIGYRAFWFPVHSQTPYAVSTESFENSKSISARGLWLPSVFKLTEDQAAYAAQVLRDALKGR